MTYSNQIHSVSAVKKTLDLTGIFFIYYLKAEQKKYF